MQVEVHDKGVEAASSWRRFLGRLTVWAAVLALSAGLVCLVAANWPGMDKWERIALAGLVLAASGGFAWWSCLRDGLAARRTQSALFVAGVAVGALLALIGQTYQTGADTWQLFAWWAVLLLPWVIGAPGAAIWLLWGLVANTALALWLGNGGFLGDLWEFEVSLIQGGFNLLLLLAWEYAAPRAGVPSHGRIGPRLAALAALGCVTMATISAYRGELAIGLLGWGAIVAFFYYRYRRVQVDLAILALLCLSGIAVSLRLLVSWVFELLPGLDSGALLLFAVILMGEAAVAVRWLRRVAAETEGGAGAAPAAREPGETQKEGPATAGSATAPAAVPVPQDAQAYAPATPDEAYSDSASENQGSPWYIHALVGFGAWLATILLVAFLALAGVVTSPGGALAIGLVLGVGATLLSWQHAGLFAEQSAIAMGGAGLLLAAFGLLFEGGIGPGAWWQMAVLGAALYACSQGSVLRLVAGLFAAVSVMMAVELSVSYGFVTEWYDVLERTLNATHGGWAPLPLASVPMAWAAAWLFLQSSGARRATRLPLAWALAVVSQAALWSSGGLTPWALVTGWREFPVYLLLSCAAVLLPVAVAAGWLGRAPVASLPTPLRKGLPLALALLAIPLLPSPAVAFALAWMIVGHAMGMRVLTFYGALGGIVYLGVYYYQLHVSLMDKGIWLCVTGLAALLLWRFALRRSSAAHEPSAAGAAALPPAPRWQRVAVPAGLCVALAASGWSVLGFERLLANGRMVLLELAPVDPRSLMQGDYMALEFAVSRSVDVYGKDMSRDGYLVLLPDQDEVGRLVRVQDDREPRADGEVLLRYRVRNYDTRIVTNAYFFPEGHAERYESARYGELRVDPVSGRALLAGLRDEQREPIR